MKTAPVYKALLERDGLPLGTSLENKVTWRLHRAGVLDRQQYQVGKYRLDYAWPTLRIGLEADGPHHQIPDMALRDVVRDAYLRARGWLIFRVDETGGNLEEQVCRVCRAVRALSDDRDLFKDGAA